MIEILCKRKEYVKIKIKDVVTMKYIWIVLLLLLIIKFKIHPVLSLLISALVIGLGAGMPVPTLVNTVEKGAGETLQVSFC